MGVAPTNPGIPLKGANAPEPSSKCGAPHQVSYHDSPAAATTRTVPPPPRSVAPYLYGATCTTVPSKASSEAHDVGATTYNERPAPRCVPSTIASMQAASVRSDDPTRDRTTDPQRDVIGEASPDPTSTGEDTPAPYAGKSVGDYLEAAAGRFSLFEAAPHGRALALPRTVTPPAHRRQRDKTARPFSTAVTLARYFEQRNPTPSLGDHHGPRESTPLLHQTSRIPEPIGDDLDRIAHRQHAVRDHVRQPDGGRNPFVPVDYVEIAGCSGVADESARVIGKDWQAARCRLTVDPSASPPPAPARERGKWSLRVRLERADFCVSGEHVVTGD